MERLYNEEKLSAREIAVKLGSSHSSINKAIKHLSINKSSKIRRPRYGRPTPNKSEAQLKKENKIIDLIMSLKQRGKSFRAIASYLNDQTTKTPSGKGHWVPSTVKRILYKKLSRQQKHL